MILFYFVAAFAFVLILAWVWMTYETPFQRYTARRLHELRIEHHLLNKKPDE